MEALFEIGTFNLVDFNLMSEEPSKVKVFWDITQIGRNSEIFRFDITYLERSEVRWRFLQSSVAFSEYMNFISVFVEKRMQYQ